MLFPKSAFIIAHRGASAFAPENTLAAFERFCQSTSHWVEFDVMLSADNIPVVIHDETLDRTTNLDGEVASHSFADLSAADAGSWFAAEFAQQHVPSLQQVLSVVADHAQGINVEIKADSGNEAKTVQHILAVIEQGGFADLPIVFSSFSPACLQALRALKPDAAVASLFHEWERDWQQQVTSLQSISVNLNADIITPERVAQIHHHGLPVLAYTVNDPLTAETLFSYGVNGLFSDNPDLLIGLKVANEF